MKLSMTVVDAEGNARPTVEKIISNNDLKRLTLICPELYGKALYQLKKNGQVILKYQDGVEAHFKIEK